MGQPEELLVSAKHHVHEKVYNFETPEDDNVRPDRSPDVNCWRSLARQRVSICKWIIGTCIAFLAFVCVAFIVTMIALNPQHNGTWYF